MSISKEQLAAINSSWDEVCKDIRTNGTDLFVTLFTAHPQYQDYFKDLRGIPLEDLRTNKKLRIHGTRVMHALSSMIQSLDELDVVAGIMTKTVDTHYKLGVKTITQYEDMFALMPDYLKRHSGDKYNKLCAEGWIIATDTLLAVIKQRFAELDTPTALTEKHIAAMQDSWDEVCKDIRSNGTDLFIRFFKAFPKYQEGFNELKGISLEELKKNKQMRIHGTRVMHALSSIIQSLDELDVVAGIMIKTVDTHYDMGVNAVGQYTDLFAVLPDFMTAHAGEKFTNKTSAEGWGIALGVLASVITQRLEQLDAQTASMK